MTRRRHGFTLIEVLAAVFLTAVVMTVAISFYVSLSDSTDAATEKARQGRLALSVLDRIARDLEGAYLLSKPPELDPLFHPWFFVAENQELDSGADRLRFITRNHRPRNALDHGSDLALVTYLLSPSEDGPGYELLRSVSPGLPVELDAEFPPASDEQYMVVAERVEHFAMRFMGEDLEWNDEWDSVSEIDQSGQLPRAAEIEIAYLPLGPELPDSETFEDFGLAEEGKEAQIYTRRVRLPMRAVNLEQMLAGVDQQAAEQAAEQDAEEEAEEDFQDDEDTPGGGDPGLLEPRGS